MLKINDRIRIVAVPDCSYIHTGTVRVFKKLIARNRPVRISRIENGIPWYNCRFKRKNGTWDRHSLAVCEGETNWVLVKHQNIEIHWSYQYGHVR